VPVLTAQTLAGWAGGRLVGDPSADAVGMVSDSRLQRPGHAFAAVRGERVDGHDFVGAALAGGAPFVVVERTETLPDGATAIVVDDTVRALGAMAAAARAAMDVRVVGITGSTGKTLTKDLVAAALGTSLRVHAAPSSFNTDVTVPLVVLGCPDDADVMVAELGARRPGEIERLCALVRPHIGVITGIGTTHLEIFGSRDAIARTKSELLSSLPADGAAFVPADDDYLATFSSSTSARLYTVGPGSDLSYRAERITPDGRTHGTVTIGGRDVGVALPVPGRALMRNAAFAIAVACEFGIDAGDAAASLRNAQLSAWRMEITAIDGWTVVNDAYNANPTSMAATLRSARELAQGPVWAVLGRMAELGGVSEHEHRRVGRLLASLGYAGVIVVGEGADGIVDGAGALAIRVGSIAEAAEVAGSSVPSGAVLVVKASRSVGLEHLVDELGSRSARVN
jgi:UDP-N-acetylmuramoyl-tripeptide--D-alanyl-D-alanine ligase